MKNKTDQPTRRQIIGAAAAAASALPLMAQAPAAQAPPAGQAPGGAAGRGRGGGRGRGMSPGGSGPIRVLLITKFHPFTREPFFQMFDSFGADITWTHVEQP